MPATEHEFAHEQASADATRPARADAINTGSSSISSLLGTLITNTGNEQTACDTQCAANSKVCLDTHTTARVRSLLFCVDRTLTMIRGSGSLREDSRG